MTSWFRSLPGHELRERDVLSLARQSIYLRPQAALLVSDGLRGSGAVE